MDNIESEIGLEKIAFSQYGKFSDEIREVEGS